MARHSTGTIKTRTLGIAPNRLGTTLRVLLCSFVRNEAAAVLHGSKAELLHKRAPEAVWITKSHGIGDVFNRVIGCGQPFARLIEP